MSRPRTLCHVVTAVALMALAGCTPSAVERANSPDQGPDAGAVTLAAASTSGMPAFGEVVPVCGLKDTALGRKVESRPEKGRAVWTLYDTAPGSSAARAFHITGFKDGCARRITASLAMFGSVELYEMVRYAGLVPAENAATDIAYDQLRRGPCGSGKQPCGNSGLRKLSRETAFLAAYPSKGSASRFELLMHRGTISASARK